MTFSDILKSSFLEKVTAISPLDAVIAMAVAFALGLFIFFVYKKTFSGVMYSLPFCFLRCRCSLNRKNS